MTVTPELISWLRAAIAARGWDVAELARRTKVHHTAWGRLLGGTTFAMSAKTVASLCEVLQLSEIQLYKLAHPDDHEVKYVGEGPPPPDDKALRTIYDVLKSDAIARAKIEGVLIGLGYVIPAPDQTRYDAPKKKESHNEG